MFIHITKIFPNWESANSNSPMSVDMYIKSENIVCMKKMSFASCEYGHIDFMHSIYQHGSYVEIPIDDYDQLIRTLLHRRHE